MICTNVPRAGLHFTSTNTTSITSVSHQDSQQAWLSSALSIFIKKKMWPTFVAIWQVCIQDDHLPRLWSGHCILKPQDVGDEACVPHQEVLWNWPIIQNKRRQTKHMIRLHQASRHHLFRLRLNRLSPGTRQGSREMRARLTTLLFWGILVSKLPVLWRTRLCRSYCRRCHHRRPDPRCDTTSKPWQKKWHGITKTFFFFLSWDASMFESWLLPAVWDW